MGFGLGVLVVIYLPAMRAAITGPAGARMPSILAGMLVSLPVALIASLGALGATALIRSETADPFWLPVLAGVVCGGFVMVVTRAPAGASAAFQRASRLWSGVPVAFRIVLLGALTSGVAFGFVAPLLPR